MKLQKLKKVTDGLYRGSAPSPNDVKWLKDNLHIKKIISLDLNCGEAIHNTCKILGIKQIIIPLDSSKESFVNLLKYNLKDLLLNGGPTYVHCLHGKDRTGLVIALFKIKYMGMNNDKALAEAKSLGFGIGVSPHFVRLYESIIRSCKPDHSDDNSADSIVDRERGRLTDSVDLTDPRSSTILDATQNSFSNILDSSRTGPAGVYNPLQDQSNSRENYNKNRIYDTSKESDSVPLVGLYNNDAGINGTGPSISAGGFISE